SALSLQCTLESLKNRKKAEKDVAACEQGWQDVSSPARTPLWRPRIDQVVPDAHVLLPEPPAATLRANIVVPADTRCPVSAASSHSGPKTMSIREPNLIIPIRSPVATRSPSRL